METIEMVYSVCAAIGATLIVCQFLLTLLGFGGDHDVGGGHDIGGHDIVGHDISAHDSSDGHDAANHHEAGHGSASSWIFSVLTFRTLSAAFAFFGLTGLATIRLHMEAIPGLVIALGAGTSALFMVAWLMRGLSRLNIDGTVRIERAIGAPGVVYLSIPGGKSGVGKVHVHQLGRTVEYKAVTAQEGLPTGAKITVVAVIGADTVEVALAHALAPSDAKIVNRGSVSEVGAGGTP